MSIRSDIQYYFEKHPNETIYLKDLTNGVDFEAKQVQSAVYQLKRNGLNLETIHQGQCWKYIPEPVAEDDGKDTMTVVGYTKKGSCILEDSKGALWIAREFDE